MYFDGKVFADDRHPEPPTAVLDCSLIGRASAGEQMSQICTRRAQGD